ncbi:unnamed protein product, partial [Mesorhabditis spiculigera]
MGKCLFFGDEATTFTGAETICESYGGSLISIHNAFENSLISAYQQTANRFFWLGLRRQMPAPVWAWSDNSTTNYYKWAPGHPDSGSACTVLSPAEQSWHSADCNERNPFICELPQAKPCRNGWSYFNYTNNCYYIGKNRTFTQADAYCQSYGGYLASVHNNPENEFIYELARTDKCANFTMNPKYLEGTVLLGGFFAKDRGFVSRWLDWSTPDYMSEMSCYKPGEKSEQTMLLLAFPAGCGACEADRGNWLTVDDDRSGYDNWMGSTKFVVFFTLLYCGAAQCPTNAVYVEAMDKCLLYSSQVTNFDGAAESCENFGGSLVSIWNGFENNLITTYQAEAKSGWTVYYMGLHREDRNSEWEWADNSTATFFKWAPGHPSAGANCAVLSLPDNSWHSMDCNGYQAFICDVPKVSPCPDGWIYFVYTDMCYYKGENMTFNQAEAYCQKHGGHLGSIHSNMENAFIYEMSYSVSCYNTSAYVMGSVLLGGYYSREQQKVSKWLDGSATDFVGMTNCYEGKKEDAMIVMFAFPINCNDCGNFHGQWYIADDEADKTNFPNFLCKAPPGQAKEE